MKIKLLIILGFLTLGIGNTAAQFAEYYYHRTGDTIYQDAPIYLHAWWKWDIYRATQEDAVLDPYQAYTPGSIKLLPFHTADTLKIVGIAGILVPDGWRDALPSPFYHGDVLYLYDYDDTGAFVQRAAIPRDSNDEARKIFISGNGWWHGVTYTGEQAWNFGPCCHNYPWDSVFPVFEYYFDSAISVIDSFFVGDLGKCMAAQHHGLHYACDAPPYSQDCVFELQPYKYYHNSAWHYGEFAQAPMVWPIIQVDTTVPPPDVCVPLTNLQAYDVDTFGLTITWDTFPQYTAVEICYGTADSLWGCITVRDTNAAALHLPDPAQADYIILARAVCDSLKHDSPWSDTLHITLPRDPLACLPVEGFAVAAVDTFAATLHWEPQPGAMAYELALLHSGTVLLDTLPASSAGHHLLSLPDTAVADYAVALRLLCDTATHEAASPWSDTLRFTLPRGLGGIAPALAGRILLQPNPASGQVQITAPCGLLQVDLHNASGTLVLSSPASGTTHTLPLDGLAAGSYIATVRTACGTAAKRLAIR